MNDRDADEVYNELAAILRQLGIGWIADQAAAEVELGQLVAKIPVRRGSSDRPGDGESRAFTNFRTVDYASIESSGRRSLIASEPYSAADRVHVLIRAVRRILVDTAAIEAHLSQFSASELGGAAAGKMFSAAESDADRHPLFETDTQREADSNAQVLIFLDRLTERVSE